MPLNADEVKMCLKEWIPAGRAAAYTHGVMNTHTDARAQILYTLSLNTPSIYIQMAFFSHM